MVFTIILASLILRPHPEKIDCQRQVLVDQLVSILHNLVDKLREGKERCCFECDYRIRFVVYNISASVFPCTVFLLAFGIEDRMV